MYVDPDQLLLLWSRVVVTMKQKLLSWHVRIHSQLM